MRNAILMAAVLGIAVGCGSDRGKSGDAWPVGEPPGEELPETGDPVVEDPQIADPVTDPDPTAVSELVGYWTQQHIGNCIQLEEWLGFAENLEFEHVIADEDACYEHSVEVGLGRWAVLDTDTVRWEWASRGQVEAREYTVGVMGGGQELAVGALVKVDDERWVARRVIDAPVSPRRVDIDLRLSGLDNDEPCQMDVVLSATFEYPESARVISAEEDFSFDCTVMDAPGVGITAVQAVGFDDGTRDRWMELFRARGIWDRYDAPLADMLFDAFRPELHIDWATPNVMLSSRGVEHYWRADREPPRSVEELDAGN